MSAGDTVLSVEYLTSKRTGPRLAGLGPDIPQTRWTLVDLVTAQSAAYGDKEFMSFEDGSSMSFRELDEATDLHSVIWGWSQKIASSVC